ncbi:hypothetical protein RFI_13104 [Reticulomyxa filosa]|uniref:Uncharacterized protein n=1 Tax=Reticulomyxa filosa TaxID=46433 RepID=X6NE83_RETFI|nr:hypothetical protein RFI_13104 [Reticulomyxa filosa]|eukprot:ETO24054.1 hypothetical protein RFI_13104 [Reticulomyxa filosa]
MFAMLYVFWIMVLAFLGIVFYVVGSAVIGYFRHPYVDKNDPIDINSYDYIMIVGTAGSGKTTLTKTLVAEYPKFHHIELDNLRFEKQTWNILSHSNFGQNLKKELSNGESWICDGNFVNFHTKREMWQKVECIVWLDYGFWIVFLFAVYRTWHRISHKVPHCNGNIDTWSRVFFGDSYTSILRFIWQTHGQFKTKKIERWKVDEYTNPNVRWIRLQSPYHCQLWWQKCIASQKKNKTKK